MNLNTGLRQLGLPEMNYGVISRESSASPASGYTKIHAQEQVEIIETAFSI
jgi:2-oxoglutarate dehydrogenase E1 component